MISSTILPTSASAFKFPNASSCTVSFYAGTGIGTGTGADAGTGTGTGTVAS